MHDKVKKLLTYHMKNDMDLHWFMRKLINKYHVIFIGGFLRDVLNNNHNSRDIDIILNNDLCGFKTWLDKHRFTYTQNRFGGYKLLFKNLEIDIWSLSDHMAFKNKYYEQSIDNIYKTTFLNYDSIVYDYTRDKLYDMYYQHCIKTKTLDLIGSDTYIKNNSSIAINIARILTIQTKINYRLSDNIIKYIKNNAITEQQLCIGYQMHYKTQISDNILKLFNAIERNDYDNNI